MKRYPAYKDSGVEWIGEIPAGWKVRPLKYLSDIVLGKMLTNEDRGGDFLRPYLRAKNLNWLSINVEDIKTMWFSKYELEQYRLNQGDLLVSEGGEVGRTCIWNNELEECYIQNSVNRVRVHPESNSRYFLYQFFVAGQKGHFDAIVNRVSIAHLTKEKLAEVSFLLPPLDEQRTIADYLDRKTAQIDTLIARKQRLIALLREERAAVINRAVTKGLDPSAPMKDSGIEWIGEIPVGWEVSPVKRYYDVALGKMLNRSNESDGEVMKPYLRAANIRPQGISIEDVNEMGFTSSQIERYRLKYGDLLVTEGGVTVGRSAIWREELAECYYQNSLNRIRAKENSDTRFLLYWMHFLKANGYIDLVSDKATFGHLTNEKLSVLPVVMPPLDEQLAIADYLDDKTTQIDQTITRAEKQIALLQEYRTALISEVVTGQVDVRGSVPVTRHTQRR